MKTYAEGGRQSFWTTKSFAAEEGPPSSFFKPRPRAKPVNQTVAQGLGEGPRPALDALFAKGSLGDLSALFEGCDAGQLTPHALKKLKHCDREELTVVLLAFTKVCQAQVDDADCRPKKLPRPEVEWFCIGDIEQPVVSTVEVIDHTPRDPFAVAISSGIKNGACLEFCNLTDAIRRSATRLDWDSSEADTTRATASGKFAFISKDYHLRHDYQPGDVILMRQRRGDEVSDPVTLYQATRDLKGADLQRLFVGPHVDIPEDLRATVAEMFANVGKLISRTSERHGHLETITTKRLGDVALSPYADQHPSKIRWNKIEFTGGGGYNFEIRAPAARSPADFAVEPGVKLTFHRADTVGGRLEPGPVLAGDEGDFCAQVHCKDFGQSLERGKVVLIQVSDQDTIVGPQQWFAVHLETGARLGIPGYGGALEWEAKFEPSKVSASFEKDGWHNGPTLELAAGAVNPFDMVTAYVSQRNKLWSSNAPNHFTAFADEHGAIRLPIDTHLDVGDKITINTRPVDWAVRKNEGFGSVQSRGVDYVVRRRGDGDLELVRPRG
jgi:hypothetical protein